MSNFDSNIIKNPEIFEQNRLAAHSDHVCYKNELEKIKGKSSLRYDMNGLWKFAYAKNQSLAPCGFEAADYDCKGWDEIRVPAHIQMEGYDVPIYTNTTYPWEADEFIKPGEVPEIFNPVASYVKYFTIPENMKNKRVCISFQGVESGFALWLNGHYVGYSEDTFDPSDFELTDYIIEVRTSLRSESGNGHQAAGVRIRIFTDSQAFSEMYFCMPFLVHMWRICQLFLHLMIPLTRAHLVCQ